MAVKDNGQPRINGANGPWPTKPSRLRGHEPSKLEDVQAAAEAHEQDRLEQAGQHDGATGKSEYLGNLVYGGLDGVITTFAVVSGVVGANLAPGIILILGLANLLGDGVSMAAGAYLSAKSEQEVYTRERRHLTEQVVQAPEAQKAALRDCYEKQGYGPKEAQRLTEIVSQEPGRWVNTLLSEQRLLLPQKRKPVLEGLATLIAFVVAGAIPLLTYLADLIFHFSLGTTTAFWISVGLSAVALFGLGAAKVFVTKRNPLRSGIEMLLVGGLAALVAFGVGVLLKALGGPTA
jgi:vacuolar iron transporter family protein